MLNRWRSRMFAAGKLSVLFLALILALAVASAVAAAGVVTATPTVVTFPTTLVGTVSTQPVTITNGTGQDVQIVSASTNNSRSFWPAQGGTCVSYIGALGTSDIPAGVSCTVEWGFDPVRAGKLRGTGTLKFSDGEVIKIGLRGIGTN